jgi:methyl-accepting chemotaxis protein
MKSMKWINDIKIGAKVFIAPLVAFIGIAIIALVGDGALTDQSRALNSISTITFPKATESARLASAIQGAHMELYRLLTWQAAGVDDKKVKEISLRFQSSLSSIQKDLERFRTKFSYDAQERTLLETLEKEISAYNKNANNVVEMLEIEFTAAVSWMWTAQGDFEKMLKSVGALQTLESELATRDYQYATAEGHTAHSLFLALAAGTLVLVIGVSLAVGALISRPVRAMTGVMARLAEGDHEVAVPATERRDEIGAIARAVEVFKENSRRVVALQAEQAEAQRRADQEKRRAMQALAQDLDSAVRAAMTAVSDAAKAIGSEAAVLSASAEQTSRQSATVGVASEQASASVESVAQAAGRLTGSIGEISQQVIQSSQIAREAVTQAARTDSTVQGLADASEKIGEVVGLITSIAAQTNLLALNATIEAARAGDAGKGFAVVASEVKALANQTARATDEITNEITNIKGVTQQSVAEIKAIGATIKRIDESLTTIAAAVRGQGVATEEISRNCSEAATGTRSVSHDIAGVRTAAERTGGAAVTVSANTNRLFQEFDSLQSRIDGLVNRLKAA